MSTTTVGAFFVRLEACTIGSLLPVNSLVFLAALTVLFSLVTWAAILFFLLKECCEWGIRKIKGTKQASAKTEMERVIARTGMPPSVLVRDRGR
jgi:hypothetical protein